MKNDTKIEVSYKMLLFALCLSLFLSCEKDDICVNGNTPLLIIRFYDKDNPETLKMVSSLRLTGDGVATPLSAVNRVTTDSIAVPLRSFENNTVFSFISNSEDDGGGMEAGNSDIVHFNYQTQEVFISRACGYVANYIDLNVLIDADALNWIASFEVVNATVENQKTAHVKIFH